jgi:hypothetical protein
VSGKRNKKKHSYNTKKTDKKGQKYYTCSYNKKKYNDVKVVSTNVKSEDNKTNKKSVSTKCTPFKKVQNNKNNYSFNKREKNQKKYFKKNKYNDKYTDQNKLKTNRVKRDIIPYEIISVKKEVCKKCGRIISDMINSISDKEKNEYYHFDCIIEELKLEYEVNANQRIAYTGSGTFAVIEDIVQDGRKKFIIKKNIEVCK